MAKIYKGSLELIGNTPLVEVVNIEKELGLEATLLVEPDRVLWYDWDGMTPQDMLTYEGTVICAEKVVWRPVEGFMGNDPFYLPADGGWGSPAD